MRGMPSKTCLEFQERRQKCIKYAQNAIQTIFSREKFLKSKAMTVSCQCTIKTGPDQAFLVDIYRDPDSWFKFPLSHYSNEKKNIGNCEKPVLKIFFSNQLNPNPNSKWTENLDPNPYQIIQISKTAGSAMCLCPARFCHFFSAIPYAPVQLS